MNDVVAVIQARMGSTRFPGKVMRQINNTPVIELLLQRLSKAKCLDEIVIATPVHPRNDALSEYVQSLGYPTYRGSEDDVLDRYYHAALSQQAKTVVRITADCPVIDPVLVDDVVGRFLDQDLDYATNSAPPTYPDGLNVEVATFAALERAWSEATTRYDREHVTPYLRDSSKFRWENFPADEDLSNERWTLDEPEDFEVITKIFEHFGPRVDFSWLEIVELLRTRPELFEMNRHIARDEGAVLGTGQKLWKRARRVLPGGSMLLSKRSEMHLPERWPAYFSKANGCQVWDLDGNSFIDAGFMGIGTNTLGYGHPEVDEAARQAIAAGNLSTLNAAEEVILAERLVELHPWADMARFARSGGEINAIAVRIARAASGRHKVAFCGYHGWHDWYLAANLGEGDNLVGHLLPGLAPKGVPPELRGTAIPFSYNDLETFEAAVADPQIGVVCMEVMRNVPPSPGFLERIRAVTKDRGIVLIFDECTSGFRQTFGGIHKMFSVEPDMATFGKTLGNGYAVTAVIGRRDVMEHAQETFISSTFWTERIGPAAAIKTLEVMERERSWETITATGRQVTDYWKQLAARHSLSFSYNGVAALAGFSINSSNALAYKTLITQEMLKRGFLASTSLYSCTAHSPTIIDGYIEHLDAVLKLVKECEDGRPVETLLDGPVCQSGFRRLN